MEKRRDLNAPENRRCVRRFGYDRLRAASADASIDRRHADDAARRVTFAI